MKNDISSNGQSHYILVKQPLKCERCIKERREEIFFDDLGVSFHWCPHQRAAGAIFYGAPGQPIDYTERTNFSASLANAWIKDITTGLRSMQDEIAKRTA